MFVADRFGNTNCHKTVINSGGEWWLVFKFCSVATQRLEWERSWKKQNSYLCADTCVCEGALTGEALWDNVWGSVSSDACRQRGDDCPFVWVSCTKKSDHLKIHRSEVC